MNRRSVVIVDDLAEIRQILRLILEHGGPFRIVGEGRNGDEAVALAADLHPDLLVMDVEMPGGPTGWEALPRIREVAPETAVVILSGSRVDPSLTEMTSLAAAVLEKGMPPKELNAALIDVLGGPSQELEAAEARGEATTDDALVSAASRIDKQQRELVRSTNELAAFASVASHDLAQPLQVAYGYLEMLRGDFGASLDPPAADWLDHAISSLERMRRLVQDILGFSRAGAQEVPVTDVDLDAVVDQAIAELDATTLDVRRGRLPSVRANQGHLVEVVRQLLANAATFAASGAGRSVVTVDAEAVGGEWVITVADEGQGVPSALQDRIFEAFQRGSAASGRGAGLGLSIARKLIERNGGRIWLDAPRTGSTGAVFRFSVPPVATETEFEETSGLT